MFNPAQAGFLDFEQITRKKITIQDIEKNLKDNKYDSVRDFCNDIKLILEGFSDYLLSDDPLQSTINRVSARISGFESKFYE